MITLCAHSILRQVLGPLITLCVYFLHSRSKCLIHLAMQIEGSVNNRELSVKFETYR